MNIGVILAGGSGSRMGIVDKPKQFIDIYGKPIIIHTLEIFDSHPEIDKIAIVCIKEWIDDLKILLRKYEIGKAKWIIEGGNTRQESTYNILKKLSNECTEDDILVIHDAVRPLLSHKIITNNIMGAKNYGAVDTVIPSADTIVKSIDGNIIDEIPKRNELYLGQTPQSFKYSLISKAHDRAIEDKVLDSTDDCQLILRLGEKVHLIEGEKLNFKVTSFDDLLLLKSIVKLGNTEMM